MSSCKLKNSLSCQNYFGSMVLKKIIWNTLFISYACSLAASAQTVPAIQTPPAGQQKLSRTDPMFVWDLTRLYATDAAWDAERKALLSEIPSLGKLKGSLNTAQGMLQAMDRISELSQKLQRLWVYASTQQSTDNRVGRNQERTALMRALGG